MAAARVIRSDSISHLERAPGVTVSNIVTEETGATKLSSGMTTFAPGASNTTHFHNAEESIIVIEGEGILVLQGQEYRLKPYDAAFITPGTHHRLINTGNRLFKIVWAYSTVHVSRTLVET